MKHIKGLSVLAICILGKCVSAQDIHFSQFNASPLNLNPALTGLFNSDYRVVANYRNQWSSITTPFRTYSASADMNIRVNNNHDIIGIGFLFNGDKAGDLDYSTTQFMPSLSYTKDLSNSELYLTYGMQAGLVQKSFNPSKATFDSQYNGDVFDPNLSSGEAFNQVNITYFDAAAGLDLFYEADEKFNANGGIAVHHLNKPVYSFNDNTQLEPLYTIHANSSIQLVDNFYLLPNIIMLKQAGNSEYTAGTYVKYSLAYTEKERLAVYLGGFMRLKEFDAAIIAARLDYNNISLGMSYDFNTSQLKAASNAQGGLEVSLFYLIKKPGVIKYAKKIPCPVFI